MRVGGSELVDRRVGPLPGVVGRADPEPVHLVLLQLRHLVRNAAAVVNLLESETEKRKNL
jgi:hypothetical protein